jgi:hypothetical protein
MRRASLFRPHRPLGRYCQRLVRTSIVVVTAALIAATGGLSAQAATRKAAPPLRVELWGDSLSAQASDYFGYFLAMTDKVTSREHVFGGTALCDWFPDIRTEIDPANTSGFHPQVAVLQFSGNAFTPCMLTKGGAAYSGQALIDKYEADSAAAIAMFAKAHIAVYFASSPLSSYQSLQYTDQTPLGVMFSRLPARFPSGRAVRFIDAATPLEWHGKYSKTLPCLSWERCTGRWPDGTKTVVVRQSDGVHFCPVGVKAVKGVVPACPVLSPGAERFALAMISPVARDFHL